MGPGRAFYQGMDDANALRTQQEDRNFVLGQRRGLAEVGGLMAQGQPKQAQNRAYELGNFDLAGHLGQQLAGVSDMERQEAQREAQMLGSVAARLQNVPVDQREAYRAPLLQMAGQYGVDPEVLSKLQLSDEGLAMTMALSQSTQQALDQLNKDRGFSADRSDTAFNQRHTMREFSADRTDANRDYGLDQDRLGLQEQQFAFDQVDSDRQYGLDRERLDMQQAELGMQQAKQDAEMRRQASGVTPEMRRVDASQLAKTQQQASQAADMLVMLDQLEASLSNTTQGTFGPLARMGAQLVPGPTGNEADAVNAYSLSKELGARALSMFGGSDTERELKVALETVPRPGNTARANAEIITRKRDALEILLDRSDFERQWVQNFGSLSVPAGDGRGFNQAWLDYQREEMAARNQYRQVSSFVENDLPAASLNRLMSSPDMAPQFDQEFGEGMASAVMEFETSRILNEIDPEAIDQLLANPESVDAFNAATPYPDLNIGGLILMSAQNAGQ